MSNYLITLSLWVSLTSKSEFERLNWREITEGWCPRELVVNAKKKLGDVLKIYFLPGHQVTICFQVIFVRQEVW